MYDTSTVNFLNNSRSTLLARGGVEQEGCCLKRLNRAMSAYRPGRGYGYANNGYGSSAVRQLAVLLVVDIAARVTTKDTCKVAPHLPLLTRSPRRALLDRHHRIRNVRGI